MEEINVGSELGYQKNNKKTIIVVALICIIALTGCIIIFNVLSKDEKTPKIEIVEANVLTSTALFGFGYNAKISGVIKNITNKELSYVRIEFVIYDEAGNNLGTASTSIENFASGDTWQFEASLIGSTDTRATSFRVGNVIIW